MKWNESRKVSFGLRSPRFAQGFYSLECWRAACRPDLSPSKKNVLKNATIQIHVVR